MSIFKYNLLYLYLLLLLAGCSPLQKPIQPEPIETSEQPIQIEFKHNTVPDNVEHKYDSETPIENNTLNIDNNESNSKAIIAKFLPDYVTNKQSWVDDIYVAFKHIGIPVIPRKVCAVMAILEQESSFQAEPDVRNLPNIIKKQLNQNQQI